MPFAAAESEDGVVLIATSMNGVLRWNGNSPSATPAGVEVPAQAQPVVTGSGAGAITGAYSAFVRFVDRFGNRGNPTPLADEAVLAGVSTVTYSNLPVPAEGGVARRQILRNTAGQYAVWYVDIDTTDVSSTSLDSTRVDSSLSAQESQVMRDSSGLTLYDRYGRPPAHLSALAFHLGRMFGTGAADYAEGSVAVELGSAAVTGTGVEWTEQMAGRFLHVPAADKPCWRSPSAWARTSRPSRAARACTKRSAWRRSTEPSMARTPASCSWPPP